MAANFLGSSWPPRRKRVMWTCVLVAPILGVLGASWWLTAPLESKPSAAPNKTTTPTTVSRSVLPSTDDPFPTWPESRLEGRAAKEMLLTTLTLVNRRFGRVEGYTATFLKQERLRGKLGVEQTLAMKVRQHPFAVYLKFLAPQAGKEVVYAEGFRDNKVIAHSTGVSRLLVPRLSVAPDHPLALADSRHPVTEAGLGNLIKRLEGFRHKDMIDPLASTILDRTSDRAGKPCLRSVHLHEHRTPDRPFMRVEVLYEPETRIPFQISSYDWPEAGHQGDLLLAERYTYENLDLSASLTALDFDPANPAYAFHRY